MFPGGAICKEPACQCRRRKRHGFEPQGRKILWRRAWQPTPVFLPGESHGQRSLVGYSPWGHREPDITETTQHGSSQGQEKVKLTIHHHTVKNHTSRTKATVSVDFIFLCSNHSKFHDVLLIHMNTHE